MISLFTFLIVCAFASFANNIITAAAPDGKFDVYRSTCFCGKQYLRIRELIPLLSFLQLKGKCRACSERIPIRYFLVETLIIGSGIVILVLHQPSIENIVSFFIVVPFIIILFTDYLYYKIPNGVLLFLLFPAAFRLSSMQTTPFVRITLSLFVMFFLFLINLYFEKQRNKQAIGFGDIKLLGVLFLLYPIYTAAAGFWFSALLALTSTTILKLFIPRFRKEPRIPFGSFITITFLLIELFHLQESIENYFILYKGL